MKKQWQAGKKCQCLLAGLDSTVYDVVIYEAWSAVKKFSEKWYHTYSRLLPHRNQQLLHLWNWIKLPLKMIHLCSYSRHKALYKSSLFARCIAVSVHYESHEAIYRMYAHVFESVPPEWGPQVAAHRSLWQDCPHPGSLCRRPVGSLHRVWLPPPPQACAPSQAVAQPSSCRPQTAFYGTTGWRFFLPIFRPILRQIIFLFKHRRQE